LSLKRLNQRIQSFTRIKLRGIFPKKENTEIQEIAKKYGRHILAGDSQEALQLLSNSALETS
jgi:hypothetical protein